MTPESLRAARAWLRRAAIDLRAAEVDLHAVPPIVEEALFHCQPAAEKALKAMLTAHGRPFRKTHDLDSLATRCEVIVPELRDDLAFVRDLTAFASIFRYPGVSRLPTFTSLRVSVMDVTLPLATEGVLRNEGHPSAVMQVHTTNRIFDAELCSPSPRPLCETRVN